MLLLIAQSSRESVHIIFCVSKANTSIELVSLESDDSEVSSVTSAFLHKRMAFRFLAVHNF